MVTLWMLRARGLVREQLVYSAGDFSLVAWACPAPQTHASSSPEPRDASFALHQRDYFGENQYFSGFSTVFHLLSLKCTEWIKFPGWCGTHSLFNFIVSFHCLNSHVIVYILKGSMCCTTRVTLGSHGQPCYQTINRPKQNKQRNFIAKPRLQLTFLARRPITENQVSALSWRHSPPGATPLVVSNWS